MKNPHVYGDAGFLYIPDIALSVPLYERSRAVKGQTIVDRENSAELFRHFNGGHCDYIADHAKQGFDAIKRCHIGMSAVIQTPELAHIYQCVAAMQGTNTGTNLVTCTGQKLTAVRWADLCLYCCNDDKGKSISMIFFKKTATMNRPIYKVVT